MQAVKKRKYADRLYVSLALASPVVAATRQGDTRAMAVSRPKDVAKLLRRRELGARVREATVENTGTSLRCFHSGSTAAQLTLNPEPLN
jgi:hypothetical protein